MTMDNEHERSGQPDLDEPRPGQELRVAREKAGISRESMAERMRIAAEQFDALERDDYAELPPPTFVRGYLRAYARELGLDPDEYIAAYNRSGSSARDPEIRGGGGTDTASGGRGGLIGLMLIALVAAGGIGAWWYQQRMGDGSGDGGAADRVEEDRGTADDSAGDSGEPGSTSGDSDAGDTTANAQGGSDAQASGEEDTDTSQETGPEKDSADADTASMDDATARASVTATQGTGADSSDDVDASDTPDSGDNSEAATDATTQPVVATADQEAPDDRDGDNAARDAEAVDNGGERNGSDMADDEDDADDAPVTEDAGDDAGSDRSAAAEPGATSPAATDSPTRAATAAAGTGPDRVTLEFSSRSWLEVYDERDRELVYTLYFGSEPITLQGWAPFEIFLGNSPAVTVRFNGEEIEKSAFTRANNTARFVVDASGARAP